MTKETDIFDSNISRPEETNPDQNTELDQDLFEDEHHEDLSARRMEIRRDWPMNR